MHLEVLGGADVGASCLVLSAAGRRILIDAGVRLGSGTGDMLPDLARLQEHGGIDAVIVTHAHADHIGALPLAVAPFPTAPILATPATCALMQVMLSDALRIAEGRWQDSGELPAFDAAAVDALLERLHPLGFHDPYPLFQRGSSHAAIRDGATDASPDARSSWQVTLCPAGHVLGAAMVLLDTPEGSVLVSGDVSLTPQRTVTAAVPPRRRVDALILESTYGNRLHSQRAAEEERLITQVADVIARGGHVLIPAFALGRAQEVLLILAAARRSGRLRAPVWVDGLVRAVCGVYQRHASEASPALRRLVERQGNPFITPDQGVRAVTSPADRDAILAGEPAVIVSSSGMLSGGPSVHYARALAPEPKAAILICGYQDEEAPGAALLALSNGAASVDQAKTTIVAADASVDQATATARTITLGGQRTTVCCEVARYHLSAHADGDELASLAERLRPHLTVLVHGDDEARAALAHKLLGRSLACVAPANGATVHLPTRQAHAASVRPCARPCDLTTEVLEASMQAAAPRAWTAFELVQRLDGVVTPERLGQAEAVLHEHPRFSPDRRVEGAYRLTQAQETQAAAQAAAQADARAQVLCELRASVQALCADTCGRDGAKSLLNEVVHVMRWPFPRYSVVQDGPPHAPTFIGTATLDIAGTEISASQEGTARSRKAAEQAAARALLSALDRRALLTTPVTEPGPRPVP